MSKIIYGKVKSILPSGDVFWLKCQDDHPDIRLHLKYPQEENIGFGTWLAFEEKHLNPNPSGWYEASGYQLILESAPEKASSTNPASKTKGENMPKSPENKSPKSSTGVNAMQHQDYFTYPYNFITPGKPLFKKGAVTAVHNRFAGDRFSGEIVCVMTALTPLFVPDAEGWEDETVENNKTHYTKPFFSMPDKKYAIPGSSVKGMIRSVAEAVSNSCFSIFDDKRFAYRLTKNIHNRRPGRVINNMTGVKEMEIARIAAGAFPELGNPEEKDVFSIAECCESNKIEFKMVRLFRKGAPEVVWAKKGDKEWPIRSDDEFKNGESRVFKNRTGRLFVSSRDLNMNIRLPLKYKSLEGQTVNFKAQKFQRPSMGAKWFAYEVNGKSALKGPFTGYVKTAAGVGKTSKETHQVFYEQENAPEFELDDCTKEDYKVAQQGKHKNPSELKDGQLVFFSSDCSRVTNIGPVQMYKDAYCYSTKELLKRAGKATDNDENLFIPCSEPDSLCTCCNLFGWAPGKGSNAQPLAGKVCFSTAKCLDNDVTPCKVTLRILSGPTPKYHPFYLTDIKRTNAYKIGNIPLDKYGWSGQKSMIRGRKFYWHHPNLLKKTEISDLKDYIEQHQIKDGTFSEEKKSDQNITAKVLPPESKFKFGVRFENLTKAELGLLLFSIDLNDERKGALCHRIGMGKPLGMGSVKVHIEFANRIDGPAQNINILKKPTHGIESTNLIDRQARYASLMATGAMGQEYTIKVFDEARAEFKKLLEKANNMQQGRFSDIPNIRDILKISNISNPPDPSEIRYRPLNLEPDKTYIFFGGYNNRREGVEYDKNRKPLPFIQQTVQNGKRLKGSEWKK